MVSRYTDGVDLITPDRGGELCKRPLFWSELVMDAKSLRKVVHV